MSVALQPSLCLRLCARALSFPSQQRRAASSRRGFAESQQQEDPPRILITGETEFTPQMRIGISVVSVVKGQFKMRIVFR